MRAILLGITFIFTVGFMDQVSAQSAVCIFQDLKTGKGDYMFRYGMDNETAAKETAFKQIVELGYDSTLVSYLTSTEKKGYGLIIRSYYRAANGINVTVYGAALGQDSYEAAEDKAIENLKLNNPKWNEELYDYNIIQYFFDEPEQEN